MALTNSQKFERNIELTNIRGEKFRFSYQDIVSGKYINEDPGSPIRPPGSHALSLNGTKRKNTDDPGSPIRPPGSRVFSPESAEKENNDDPGSPIRPPGSHALSLNGTKRKNTDDPGSPIRPPGSKRIILGVANNGCSNKTEETRYMNNNLKYQEYLAKLPTVLPPIELKNCHGEKLQFSIKDIPENRYDEVIEFMYTFFIHDDMILSDTMNKTVTIMKNIWKIILEKNISIAAFTFENETDDSVIAAVDLLLLMDVSTKEQKDNNTANKKKNEMFSFVCVHPKFRGLGLGKKCEMSKIRNEIEQENVI